jgi:small subunit ribosomal protein S1
MENGRKYLMNAEMNKEVAQEPKVVTTEGGRLPKKKRKVTKRPVVRDSVTYSASELETVEGQPFWNAVSTGKIKLINDDGLIVSIAKGADTLDVFVPTEELIAGHDRNVGQEIRVYVDDSLTAHANSDHPIVGSETKALDLDLLEQAAEAQKNHSVLPCYVVGEIKGGYVVALFAQNREQSERGFGLRAFLPLGRTGLRRDQVLPEHEHELQVQISELDPARGNIVVSRREVLAEGRKLEAEKFFSTYKIGDQVSGVVTALMPYGAFVSLGGIDGFLHISDISWDKKPRAKDIVPVGKEIRAQIIGIDQVNKKVKLSIKDLNTDPWQNIEKIFKPGTEVSGSIVAFAEFGAFVKLQDGVEGLIHLGEITWSRIKHPSQQFKIGDPVKAAVLRVDKEARRISLSTKALELSPVERLSGMFPVGTVIKTKVVSIHDFGIFVELDEKSQGLVPRSEISWQRSEEPLDKSFTVGQELEVAVLGYDSNRQRISCSIKRLNDDPWIQWRQKFRRGTHHKVKVLQATRKGLLCQLDGELSAFCPASQLVSEDGEQRVNVKVGDEIEVVVTACEPQNQRVSISQKAAAESETKQAYASYLSEQGQSRSRTTLGDAFKKLDINKGKK